MSMLLLLKCGVKKHCFAHCAFPSCSAVRDTTFTYDTNWQIITESPYPLLCMHQKGEKGQKKKRTSWMHQHFTITPLRACVGQQKACVHLSRSSGLTGTKFNHNGNTCTHRCNSRQEHSTQVPFSMAADAYQRQTEASGHYKYFPRLTLTSRGKRLTVYDGRPHKSKQQ